MSIPVISPPGSGDPPRHVPPTPPAPGPDGRTLPVPIQIQFALVVVQATAPQLVHQPGGEVMPLKHTNEEAGCRAQAFRTITQYLAGETWVADAPSAASIEPVAPPTGIRPAGISSTEAAAVPWQEGGAAC